MSKIPGQRKPCQKGGADHIANVFTYKTSMGKGNTGGKNISSGGSSSGCMITAAAMGATLLSALYGAAQLAWRFIA